MGYRLHFPFLLSLSSLRITQEELSYITDSSKTCPNYEVVESPLPIFSSPPSSSVPWLSIAKSLPVWAIIAGEIGNSFGYSVYFSYLPTYIEHVVGVSLSQVSREKEREREIEG